MITQPADATPGKSPPGKAWGKPVFLRFFTSRGRWFWFPVGFIGAISIPFSAIFFLGGVLSIHQGKLLLAAGLHMAGIILLFAPMLAMGMILESVRGWLEPSKKERHSQQ